MTERLSGKHPSELEAAQQATEWFTDMIYGFRDDIPDNLPPIALQRLIEHFSSTDTVLAKLNRIRDVFIHLEYDDQLNFSVYFSGYPQQAVEALVEDLPAFSRLLDTHFPRPKLEPKPPLSTHVVKEFVRSTPSDNRKATPIGNLEEDLELAQLFSRSAETGLGWQALAICAQTDPDMFFPEKGGSTREAKKTCTVCEVREECLDYAIEHDERFGIWGGKSERERRKITRERKGSLPCVKVFLTREKRLKQLTDTVNIPDDEEKELLRDQPRFAKFVYGLLEAVYGDEEEVEETDTRSRLAAYFVTSRKQKDIKHTIDLLEDDLPDFFERLIMLQQDYTRQDISFVDFYARPRYDGSRAANLGVSRFVRKRTEREKELAEQEAEGF